mmetsp:Transcript_16942/g.34289  ORF Transcript_16942/g.34289 Transcript_16942/m.34289 type:complete len:384 (-) Transcript_16942:500-1651(-)
MAVPRRSRRKRRIGRIARRIPFLAGIRFGGARVRDVVGGCPRRGVSLGAASDDLDSTRSSIAGCGGGRCRGCVVVNRLGSIGRIVAARGIHHQRRRNYSLRPRRMFVLRRLGPNELGLDSGGFHTSSSTTGSGTTGSTTGSGSGTASIDITVARFQHHISRRRIGNVPPATRFLQIAVLRRNPLPPGIGSPRRRCRRRRRRRRPGGMNRRGSRIGTALEVLGRGLDGRGGRIHVFGGDGRGGAVGAGASPGAGGSDDVVVAVAAGGVGVGASLHGGAVGSRVVVGIGSGHPHGRGQVQVGKVRFAIEITLRFGHPREGSPRRGRDGRSAHSIGQKDRRDDVAARGASQGYAGAGRSSLVGTLGDDVMVFGGGWFGSCSCSCSS